MRMRKFAVGIIIVVIVLAVAAYAADRYAQAWAAKGVDDFLAGGQEITGTHGAVTYSLWRRSIDVHDIVLRFATTPGHSVRAAAFSVDGVGPFGSAGMQSDGTMTADLRFSQLSDEDATTGTSTTAGKLAVRGFHTRAALLGHPLTSTDDWKAFLQATTIEHVDAAEVTLALRDQGGTLTVGHAVLDQLKPGGIDRLALDTATLITPQGGGRLATAEIDGVAYAVGDASAAPRFFVAKARIADLAGGPTGEETQIKEVLGGMIGTPEKPEGGTLTVKAIDIPASVHPMIGMLGYDRLLVDFTGKTGHEAGGVFDNQSELSMPKAGTIDLSFRFSNYQPGDGSLDMAALMARLQAARLDRFELRYQDASLADRLFHFYALNANVDAAALREKIIAPLAAQRAAMGDKPHVAADLDAVIAFLRKPGTITITAAPPQPVPVSDLMGAMTADPEATVTKLGLTVH